jgi:hypothetical protein
MISNCHGKKQDVVVIMLIYLYIVFLLKLFFHDSIIRLYKVDGWIIIARGRSWWDENWKG